jgi:hypothetical protein
MQTERSDVSYHGLYEGIGRTYVYVERACKRTPLTHHVRHRPTGFMWGYGGSGPADLARCVLSDYLGLSPLGTTSGIYDKGSIPEIERIYHQFKFDLIAALPRGGASWSISGDTIATWLNLHPPQIVCRTCRMPRDECEPETCYDCTHSAVNEAE